MSFHTYFLSLGSNQGDRHYYLEEAQKQLAALKGLTLSKVSQIYETSPVNCPPESPHFLNMVVECHALIKPLDFLAQCKAIEAQFGRQREQINMPRFLDIDIVFIDDLIISDCDLMVPHPEAHQRLFVLKPFLDICPDFIHPIIQEPLSAIYTQLQGESCEKVQLWQPSSSRS